jgi:hypothetical protein
LLIAIDKTVPAGLGVHLVFSDYGGVEDRTRGTQESAGTREGRPSLDLRPEHPSPAVPLTKIAKEIDAADA